MREGRFFITAKPKNEPAEKGTIMYTQDFRNIDCQNSSYIQSDLAMERRSADGRDEGIEYSESELDGITLTRLRVTSEAGEKTIGRPKGNYVTLGIGRPWLMGDAERSRAEELLAQEICTMARQMCDCKSVLAAGLGNRAITADALGPAVTDGLVITRHVKIHEKKLFDSLFACEVASLAPGVLAQTGIETLELVRGAVERVKPSLVIVIDALAARAVDRLATTVQLCDTGIAPGSGIGNSRAALGRHTLGVPVMAIGVPTVVNSSTLVRDALELGGINEISPELENVLENGRGFFVSLKESDIAVRELSAMIARAINRAFGCTEVM